MWLPAPAHVDGDVIRTAPVKRGAGGVWLEVPAELYLREARLLDLTSTRKVEEFVERFGWMGVGAHLLGGADRDAHATQYLPQSYDLRAEVRRRSIERSGEFFETIEEFRAAVLWLRDLTRVHAEHLVGGLEHGPSWWDSGRRFERGTFGFGRPGNEKDSLDVLATGLTTALADYRLRVDVIDLSAKQPPARGPVPLFVALAAQLYNHVVEGSVYLTCANASCRRLFVRQRGRAEHGQHRTKGVQFCTTTCARAQAQRDYRRRNSTKGKNR